MLTFAWSKGDTITWFIIIHTQAPIFMHVEEGKKPQTSFTYY